jgi:GT2 family glycosyltransferase
VIHNGLLRFDEEIPSTHFYGADICLQARSKGLKCYAIDAYCYHNSLLQSRSDSDLPPGFYLAKRYLRRKWRKEFPIATTSSLLLLRRTIIVNALRSYYGKVVAAIPLRLRKPVRPIYYRLFPR